MLVSLSLQDSLGDLGPRSKQGAVWWCGESKRVMRMVGNCTLAMTAAQEAIASAVLQALLEDVLKKGEQTQGTDREKGVSLFSLLWPHSGPDWQTLISRSW